MGTWDSRGPELREDQCWRRRRKRSADQTLECQEAERCKAEPRPKYSRPPYLLVNTGFGVGDLI